MHIIINYVYKDAARNASWNVPEKFEIAEM